ncbi:MAG: MFS transporter [Nitrospinae bacterium]|nr:MFS transporter [Nitrospinota bacterium]
MTSAEITQKTYRFDMLRGGCRGVLTTATQTFGLFIAIRYFDAGFLAKSLIGAAPFMGMFLSLALVYYASTTGLRKSVWGAIPSALCGCCLLGAAFMNSLWTFGLMVVLSFIALNSLTPFLTSIYNDNYPHDQRGAYFSKPLRLTVAVSVLFGFLASWVLDLDLTYYKPLFVLFGLAAFVKAWAILSMPSGILEPHAHKHPLGSLKYVLQDRDFGYVLLTWFIMGFANLWVLPLRVDYVTSSAYGIEGSAMLVAIIITVIPDSMRFLFIPFWARLFDQMNFIVLRMILNTSFGLGIALFFLTREPVVIACGSALIGIAFAGGSIAWGLWVTKYAPPGKVAAYMSVHVGLTGIRGTIGPMIGFWAVGRLGPVNIGLVSLGLMIIATLMLIPEIGHGKKNLQST